MRFDRSLLWAALAASALVTVGCEDPAKDAPKAAVGSAKPVATASSKPAASGAASAAATATATAAAPTMPAGAIKLEPGDSKIEFVGSKVTGKHEGVFEKFSGWIALDGEKAESAKIFVEIDAASVKTDSPKLDGHLKSEDFFDVAKNPTATFQSTEIKPADGGKFTITGNLKLHGVEKSVSFPAEVKVEKDKVTAKAEFSINRKDFELKYPGKPDDLIRDEVLIKLTIAGKRG